MDATQNIRCIIAAALIAASASLALSSCAGQRQLQDPAPEEVTETQIAEPGTEYLDLAERRANLSAGGAAAGPYLDQVERRIGLTGPVPSPAYRDLAERRLWMTGH